MDIQTMTNRKEGCRDGQVSGWMEDGGEQVGGEMGKDPEERISVTHTSCDGNDPFRFTHKKSVAWSSEVTGAGPQSKAEQNLDTGAGLSDSQDPRPKHPLQHSWASLYRKPLVSRHSVVRDASFQLGMP